MSRLVFFNAAMLTGLAALAIPVLIHLLLKRKKQRLRFSSVQFFKRQEQSSTRRRLKHFLLLATRLLLFAALVLAFARPYLPESVFGHGQPSKQTILVLDSSASMRALAGGQERWMRARELVKERLGKFDSNDRVAVVRCSARPETIVPLSPPEQARAVVEKWRPDFGTADLSEGLRVATGLLENASGGAQSILVISDFQRNACKKLSACGVAQEIELELLPVDTLNRPNLAISDLALSEDKPDKATIVVNNFADEPAQTRLCLAVDGAVAASCLLSLEQSGSTNVSMALPALSGGWHSIEARLSASDALADDNVRYEAIFVPPAVRISVVEPRLSKRVFEERSFFVTRALNPAGKPQAGKSNFALQTIAPETLAQTLLGTRGADACKLVVLPALATLPEGCEKALNDFVMAGGSLLLFLGDEVSAQAYNSRLGPLLPVRLERSEGDLERPEQYWRLENVDKGCPIFAAFAQPNSGDLLLPEFKRRFALRPTASAQVLARFGDGMPLLVAADIGRGRVLVVNTSADTSWTDWPKRKTFVPWIHGAARFLTGDAKVTRKETVRAAAGEDLDLELGATAASRPMRVLCPGGEELSAATGKDGRLRLECPSPGIYSVRDAAGTEIQRVPANLPAQESDLLAMSADEFQSKIARVKKTSDAAVPLSIVTSRERPLWRHLLVAALALLIIEVLLANRTPA